MNTCMRATERKPVVRAGLFSYEIENREVKHNLFYMKFNNFLLQADSYIIIIFISPGKKIETAELLFYHHMRFSFKKIMQVKLYVLNILQLFTHEGGGGTFWIIVEDSTF